LLLAGYQRVVIPNADRAELVAERDRLNDESKALQSRKAAAEDYAARFDAGLEEARQVARFLLRREVLRQKHVREAAVANAQSQFLN